MAYELMIVNTVENKLWSWMHHRLQIKCEKRKRENASDALDDLLHFTFCPGNPGCPAQSLESMEEVIKKANARYSMSVAISH